jgi:hypothetical protein
VIESWLPPTRSARSPEYRSSRRRHNGIPVRTRPRERCCGMPRLELGDLPAIDAARRVNIPVLAGLADEGWDLVAPVPSCVLMFKQELPLLFADDAEVQKVRTAMFDPFEYLMRRHRAGLLRTDFGQSLGKVSYHVACHLRVQNLGLKTRDVLARADRALLGPRRHLRCQEGVPRHLDEDRTSRVQPSRRGGGGSLLERLPDGGAADRVGARTRRPADASAYASAQGLWNLKAWTSNQVHQTRSCGPRTCSASSVTRANGPSCGRASSRTRSTARCRAGQTSLSASRTA